MDNRRKAGALRKQYAEMLAETRWFHYAKAEGMFLPGYLDDTYFTQEQADFFLEYELQFEEDEDLYE